MRTSQGTVWRRKARRVLGIAALGCLMGAAEAGAAISPEFESLHAAIVAQDEDAALTFINSFPSSPLVDDLIAMLPPAVAQRVCADLPDGAARAQAACRKADMRAGAGDRRGGPLLAGKDRDAAAGARGLSPAAARGFAAARSRSVGATGERTLGATAMVLPPGLEDSPAAPEDDAPVAKAVRKEPQPAPKRPRAAPPAAPAPDPESDPKGESGGNDGRDSHR